MNRPYQTNSPMDRTQYAAAFNEGLRVYMQKVFGLMAIALSFSGAIAYFVGNDPHLIATLFMSPMRYVVIFAPLVVVLIMSFKADSLSLQATQGLFWLYAGLMGVSLASIFAIYTGASIARVFFITSSMFGGMALYGYTTKKDLTSWGSFLFMGLIGVVVASLINLILQSNTMQLMISFVAVIVFTGLTAYDTQKIKDIYYESDSLEVAGKKAIFGALTLYLDFINIFIALLRIFGDRRN